MSIAEQVALTETALAALKSEVESLRGKLSLSNAECDRLESDKSRLESTLDIYIKETSRMQTLLDAAGVLLIEGRKTGDALQTRLPMNQLKVEADGQD